MPQVAARRPIEKSWNFPLLRAYLTAACGVLIGRTMRRRSLFHLLLAAAFSFTGASCLSPTLPLPPPEPESFTLAPDGLWTISGSCIEGALVTVFNETQGQGVVIEDLPSSGTFVVKLKADLCDTGWVSQMVGNDISLKKSFVIEPRSLNDKTLSTSCR